MCGFRWVGLSGLVDVGCREDGGEQHACNCMRLVGTYIRRDAVWWGAGSTRSLARSLSRFRSRNWVFCPLFAFFLLFLVDGAVRRVVVVVFLDGFGCMEQGSRVLGAVGHVVTPW